MPSMPHNAPTAYDPSYAFCLFRIPKSGGRVIWEVTNTCNYGCRYCIFSSTGRQQKDELDTAQALSVIDDLKAAGFTHIKITGGEPFMRPDIMDILRHARTQDMHTDISTNAAYITADMAQELAALGLEMVHVSLDGHTRELQETIRGKNTWDPTMAGIKALVDNGIHVRIGCVLYSDNQYALRDIAAFCENIGAGEVIFSLMEPVGRMKKGKQMHLLATRAVADIKNDIAILAAEFDGRISVKGNFADAAPSGCGTCPGGEKFLFIDHKGRVSPCTWVSERAPQYINGDILHTHSLKDILQGRDIGNFRKTASCMASSGVGRCPVQDMTAFGESEKIRALFDQGLDNGISPSYFAEIAQVYPATTENIAESFSALGLADKNVLTVTGSGDQILNAAILGAASVTAFDVNLLAKYHAQLKSAAFEKLAPDAFEQYLSFENYQALRDTLPFTARHFWDNAFRACANDVRTSRLFRNTPALQPPDSTLAARNLRNNAYTGRKPQAPLPSVDYITTDAATLPQKIQGRTFDIIWLSNICDYAHKIFTGDYLAAYRDNIVMPLLPHLARGGKIAISYVYDTQDRNGSSRRSLLNIPAARRAAFAPPAGFAYKEINVSGAIERDNPDVILMWEKLDGK